ncbi:MAG: GxxExxY protein [Anaerolineales bacterium]
MNSNTSPPLSEKEEKVAAAIVAAALAVHRALGPGLLENIYEVCFCHELSKQGSVVARQVELPIVYDGIQFEEAVKLDVMVEDVAICELKSVETMHPVFTAQLLTYLKHANKRLGFLINFNVPLIKDGLKRVVR